MQKQCFCIPKRVGLEIEAELQVISYMLPVLRAKLGVHVTSCEALEKEGGKQGKRGI